MLLHHSVDLDSELSSTLTSTLAPSANWRGGAFIPKTLRMPAGVGEGGFALNGRGRKCVRGLGLGGGSKEPAMRTLLGLWCIGVLVLAKYPTDHRDIAGPFSREARLLFCVMPVKFDGPLES